MTSRATLTLCIVLALTATVGTLGGILLGLDRSLWPADAYVLYVGQYSHVLLLLSCVCALVRLRPAREHVGARRTSVVLLILALVALLATWRNLFPYGYWPS